jgi:hypothetical protein
MSTAIFEKYAAARIKYPDDIERIEKEEQRVRELLLLQDLSQHEAMQKLLAMCREAIITARRRLATDRTLLNDTDAQRDLWSIIDARLWTIQILSHDVKGELALIEAGLDVELQT